MTSTSPTSSSKPAAAGTVRRVVTTRDGGVSRGPYASFNLGDHVGDDPAAVAANRARVVEVTGVDAVVWMDQTHSTNVRVVDGPGAGPVPDCDGLVTATPGLGVAVLTADCVPVLLADPRAGVVGAVHAGRRGAAAGIATAAVAAMEGLGADRGRIEVLLGPAICGRCYEVPAAMRDEVEATLPGSACVTRDGTPGIDLHAGLRAQLAAAGVGAVAADTRCTREDPALYSYRRDPTTGRLAGLIWAER
jgi:YfiH family protein